jgi:hypothetical protein
VWVFFCLLKHKDEQKVQINVLLVLYIYVLMVHYYLTDNKKPQRSGNYLEHDPQQPVSEIIMNDNPIQSNLPEFGQSRMTSERLLQHPAPKPKQSIVKEVASNVAAWMLVFSVFLGLSVMVLHAADKEAAYQAEAIAKAVGEGK